MHFVVVDVEDCRVTISDSGRHIRPIFLFVADSIADTKGKLLVAAWHIYRKNHAALPVGIFHAKETRAYRRGIEHRHREVHLNA